jgi:MFS family permease
VIYCISKTKFISKPAGRYKILSSFSIQKLICIFKTKRMEQAPIKTSKKSLIAIIAASSAGTIIEWYDFFIFGSLATIISTKFFPKENATAAFLATLATFAVGFVVRPFGALFFGRVGDLIGRKYTFMVTLIIMGGSTFAIGLVPTYETIGFFAPLIVLIIRLLQGMAIGGEYGGAATFVAEHSPANKRGFWTSWIQIAALVAVLISLGVILLTKSAMDANNWETWGWRIPFLISIFLVGISFYIRRNMSESPLFAKAKADGKISVDPLKESFGKKANLKIVLLALFGVTMGTGVMSWSSTFYVQPFMLKTMFIDYNQVNSIVIIGMLLSIPFYIFFGWLSDKIGRKPLILVSLLLSIVCFRPVYEQMYQTTNLIHKTEDKAKTISFKKQETLPDGLIVTSTSYHFYTDNTIDKEVKKVIYNNGKNIKTEVLKTITINNSDKWILIGFVFLLIAIGAIGYGPLAAFLVEMFPLKIRYTSLSLPFHIGHGIFGGMALVIVTYLVDKATEQQSDYFYLAGLAYPIVIMCIAFVIGLLYLKDNTIEQSIKLTKPEFFKKVRKYLGIIWILLGLAATYFGIFKLGLPKIISGNQEDMIFGIIMMLIIGPISTIGLFILGIYALKGEYNE